jgi:3,4-dihydroxy 2-butanone 4-phosphate synthase/GTP cyclohydrolase II
MLGRVHQESVLGDVFRVSGADSRWKLEYALRQIEAAGRGVVVYLQKPAPRLADELARIAGKQRPKTAVDRGAIGLPPDLREFGIGAQILLDQGVRQLKIITASRQRIKGVEGYGIEVVDQIVIPPRPAGAPENQNSPRTPGEGSLS